MPPAIAFFDLDRTLISVNSARLWVARQRREGAMARRDVARAMLWFALYRLGKAGMDEALHSGARTLAGQDEAALRAESQRFWDEELAPTVRPAVPAVLAAHRAAGDRLVLLTASSGQLGAACAAALGLDAVLSNRFEVVDGRFTGRLHTPLCFGPGKTVHAREHADQHGISLDDCSFYTDSMSDVHALRAVGRPVVVDPDPRLAREARAQGWERAHWG